MGNVNIFFKEKRRNRIVQLPVVPEEVQITCDGNIENINVINLGEVPIAKTPKPIELTFDCFFPSESRLSLVQTRGDFWEPIEYVKYFKDVMKRKNPMLVTITGFPRFCMDMLISNFEYTWEGGANDCAYSLTLVKYKRISITSIPLIARYTKPEPPATVATDTSAAATSKQVTPGCEVILNGTVHNDSYGNGPGKTFSNYHGKVNFVKTDGRSHPYHVTTLSGGWLGWVVPSAVTVL